MSQSYAIFLRHYSIIFCPYLFVCSGVIRLNKLVGHNLTALLEYMTVVLEYFTILLNYLDLFQWHSKHLGRPGPYQALFALLRVQITGVWILVRVHCNTKLIHYDIILHVYTNYMNILAVYVYT